MTNLISRYDTLPGFAIEANQDTDTHYVEVGMITDGKFDFRATVIRSNKISDDGFFLISKIADEKNAELWNFKQEHFDGLGTIAKAGDAYVIALIGKGWKGKVERIVPFSTMKSHQPMDLRQKIELKKLAAEFLNRDFELSEPERLIQARDVVKPTAEQIEKQRELAAQIAAEEAVKKQQREAARAERVRKILAREVITGFTAEQQERYGVPVLSGEWPSLPDKTRVIIVSSYDDETATVGNLIEAFAVMKLPQKNPQKQYCVPVSAEVSKPAAPVVKPKNVVIFKGEEAYEALLFPTMDDLRAAQRAGLNGGSYATVNKVVDGKVEVYAVRKDGIKTIGCFELAA
jgi:hypothetical protein